MSQRIKWIVTIIYFIVLGMIVKWNANSIIVWLNRSLFEEYMMDIDMETVNHSFFYGTSLIFFMTFLLYAVIGTFSVTLIIVNVIWAGLIIANQIKVLERNEFITFNELYTLTSPKELLKLVDLPIGLSLVYFVLFLLFLVGLHIVTKKLSKKIHFHIGLHIRVAIFIVAFIPLLFIFMKPDVYNATYLKFEEVKSHNFNPVQRARKDGFLPSFIHTIHPNYMDKPEHYTKTSLLSLQEKYDERAKEINQDRKNHLRDSQTIYYLSETFIDPMNIPNLLANETPIPFISSMLENHFGGTIYSQYIGGGTANIEWSILTSFSLEVFNEPIAVTPYSDFYVQSSNHHTVMSFFDQKKIALHPYSAHLYKRKSVYDAIGFDDFLYLENGIQHTDKLGSHKRISDAALHKDVLREAAADDVGFIHVLTMQNHSPFGGEIPTSEYHPNLNEDVYPKNRMQEMTNYLQGLHASDQAIADLITQFDQSEKEINFVFYGDHFPSLFRGLEDQFPGNQLHETPWFIYMNHNRSLSDVNMDGLSPIFLTTLLLQAGEYYVSPFQALMDDLLHAGVKRIGKDFIVTGEGIVTDARIKDDHVLQLVKDYRLIMYDALFGSNRLADSFYIPNVEKQ